MITADRSSAADMYAMFDVREGFVASVLILGGDNLFKFHKCESVG